MNDLERHSRSSELPVFDSHRPIYHFLLAVCRRNVSILDHCRNFSTFTVYVTACDLEKSFSFDMRDSLNYKPLEFSDSCLNIVVNS